MILFSVLLTVLAKPAMNEVYLIVVSYFIVLSFLTMEISLSWFVGKDRPLTATLITLSNTYLTYALLPIGLKYAILVCTLMAVVHMILLGVIGKMVDMILCTGIIMLCANIAGVCTHYPREVAQRKAFLETRQCIEARLKIQRENQQQVNLFQFLFWLCSVELLLNWKVYIFHGK